ncbi:hypothetical protein [Kocuria tytonicola]|uniref:hypothetical protein n=1 Tax=Kocuria tytonicola TaxID=2055946 RepID=UPI00197EED20|nr:hypothetical protein [Kocuria tytonicola]
MENADAVPGRGSAGDDDSSGLRALRVSDWLDMLRGLLTVAALAEVVWPARRG